MIPNFLLAIDHTLHYEGGYKPASPDDPAGETNFGISKRSYPDLDIKALTLDQARAIYKADFWDKYQLGAITEPNVAAKVLDLLVNCGPHGGTEIIQRALCSAGVPTNADGAFGLQTLANLNKPDSLELLAELRAQAAVHYAQVVASKPETAVYLNGWMKRAVRP